MADQAVGRRLVIGLVRGLHGLRGALRVEVLTDDPRRFARGSVLHVEAAPDPLTVSWSQRDEKGILVRFAEVRDREAAESLRGRYLEADVASGALPAGTYYWHEVIGARVTTSDGRDLGRVEDVFRAGGGEVFVARGSPWGEVMVPAVTSVVRELAPAEGRVVVDAAGLALDEAPPRPRPRGRRTSRAAKAVTLGGAVPDPPGGDPAPDPTPVTTESGLG